MIRILPLSPTWLVLTVTRKPYLTVGLAELTLYVRRAVPHHAVSLGAAVRDHRWEEAAGGLGSVEEEGAQGRGRGRVKGVGAVLELEQLEADLVEGDFGPAGVGHADLGAQEDSVVAEVGADRAVNRPRAGHRRNVAALGPFPSNFDMRLVGDVAVDCTRWTSGHLNLSGTPAPKHPSDESGLATYAVLMKTWTDCAAARTAGAPGPRKETGPRASSLRCTGVYSCCDFLRQSLLEVKSVAYARYLLIKGMLKDGKGHAAAQTQREARAEIFRPTGRRAPTRAGHPCPAEPRSRWSLLSGEG